MPIGESGPIEALKRIHQAAAGRATRLDLSGLGLTRLPLEIASLTSLQELDLDGNQLTTLPPAISGLTQLTEMDLRGSQLRQLPPEITSLTALRRLSLGGNHLTELPPAIGSLTALQSLELSGNQLTTLPASIGRLTALRTLELDDNRLSLLPPAIGSLAALETLELGGNLITTLLPEIGSLTRLRTLELSGNQLTSLPASVGLLAALRTLELNDNQLAELPVSIGSLAALETLELGGNRLTTLPPAIGSLRALRILKLEGNQLVDLSPNIGSLVALRTLELGENRLTTLPAEIGSLFELRELELQSNAIGDADTVVGLTRRLKNLATIVVHENPLRWPGMDHDVSDEMLYETNPKRLREALLELRRSGGATLGFARAVSAGVSGAGKTHLFRRMADPDDPDLNWELDEQPDNRGSITKGAVPYSQKTAFDPAAYGVRGLKPLRLMLTDVGGHREQIKAHYHLVYLAGQAVFVLCVSLVEEIDHWPRYYLHLLADLARRAYIGRKRRDDRHVHLLPDLGAKDRMTVIVVPTKKDKAEAQQLDVAALRARIARMCNGPDGRSALKTLTPIVTEPVNNLDDDDVGRVLRVVARALKDLPDVVKTEQKYIPSIVAEVERRFARPEEGSGETLKVSMEVDTELREIATAHGSKDLPYVVRVLLRLGVAQVPLENVPDEEDKDLLKRASRLINPEFLNREVYERLMERRQHGADGFFRKRQIDAALTTRTDIEQRLVEDILKQCKVAFDWRDAGLLIPDQFEMRSPGRFEPWEDAAVQRKWAADTFVAEHALFELMAQFKGDLEPVNEGDERNPNDPRVFAYRDACLFVRGEARVQVYLDVLTRELSMHANGRDAGLFVDRLFGFVEEHSACRWAALAMPTTALISGNAQDDTQHSQRKPWYQVEAAISQLVAAIRVHVPQAADSFRRQLGSGTASHTRKLHLLLPLIASHLKLKPSELWAGGSIGQKPRRGPPLKSVAGGKRPKTAELRVNPRHVDPLLDPKNIASGPLFDEMIRVVAQHHRIKRPKRWVVICPACGVLRYLIGKVDPGLDCATCDQPAPAIPRVPTLPPLPRLVCTQLLCGREYSIHTPRKGWTYRPIPRGCANPACGGRMLSDVFE